MGRDNPPNHSPPRSGHGGRGRSPPSRRYGGHRGRKEQGSVSLLVRNIPLRCRHEDLRVAFERFGPVRDVYMPRDYYSREPRGFAFVEFVHSSDASEAQCRMNHQMFSGREITVVVAAQTRKRPEEMRRRTGVRDNSDHEGRRTSRYGRSRSRSCSRSRSPRHGGRVSRSYSPAPRRQDDYSASPKRNEEHQAKSSKQSKGHDKDEKQRPHTSDDRDAGHGVDNGSKESYSCAPRKRDDYSASPKRKEEPQAKSSRESKEHDKDKKQRSHTPDDRDVRYGADNGPNELYSPAPRKRYDYSASPKRKEEL